MTSESDARLAQWQRARTERLATLPWLQTDVSGGRTVRYAKGELLIRADQEAAARALVIGQGIAATQITTQAVAGDYMLMTAPGADIGPVVGALRTSAGPAAAGPNHVFVSTKEGGIEIGGPYGPPVTVDAYPLPSGPSATASLRVAVVDTGVWTDSPLPKSWYDVKPADIVHATGDHIDTGHANFITGVIMAHTTNAKVRIVRVLDADGVCREHELARALLALDNVDIVNLSLGGFTDDDQPPLLLQAALTTLLQGQDRVVVAAAGNDGVSDRPHWPAAFAGGSAPFAGKVIAVAAHDGTHLCSWSNTGPWVGISAPGSNIVSTYVNHADFPSGFAQWSGTSFAAPFVVAAIAASHTAGDTVAGAVENVKKRAGSTNFGGYPGLA